MEEVTEYDTVIQCDHSYNRRCAKSLKTTYEAQQVRERGSSISSVQCIGQQSIAFKKAPLMKDSRQSLTDFAASRAIGELQKGPTGLPKGNLG